METSCCSLCWGYNALLVLNATRLRLLLHQKAAARYVEGTVALHFTKNSKFLHLVQDKKEELVCATTCSISQIIHDDGRTSTAGCYAGNTDIAGQAPRFNGNPDDT